MEVVAKMRYKDEGSKAILTPLKDGRVAIDLPVAQRAITPGQLAVFYLGDTVVGSGWIES
jgi:tRNA-specific 2-thiouridylase